MALTLDWPTDTAPATEIVAVTRDTAGAVLDTQRLTLPADTRNAVLPLPSLSRQASTVQVGALVDDAFCVAKRARPPSKAGKRPEQMQLNAALSASFSDAYLCNSGQVIALFPDGDAVRLEGQRFSPAGAGREVYRPRRDGPEPRARPAATGNRRRHADRQLPSHSRTPPSCR